MHSRTRDLIYGALTIALLSASEAAPQTGERVDAGELRLASGSIFWPGSAGRENLTQLVGVQAVKFSSAWGAQQRVNADAQLLQEFKTRVDDYVRLRSKVDDGAPAQKETSDPAKIKAAQLELQKRMMAARPAAKHGDIFSDDIARHFRRLLHPETRDTSTKEAIADDKPGNVAYKVMAPYPDAATLSTVPPNVLASLPMLPKDMEYRFVGKHLILRDARANLIIDYIGNVLP
jgi:hypothetical protein